MGLGIMDLICKIVTAVGALIHFSGLIALGIVAWSQEVNSVSNLYYGGVFNFFVGAVLAAVGILLLMCIHDV